jgi:hypothetical protein
MKRKIIIAIIFSALSFSISAQNYTKAIGLRIGFGAGITYKQLFNNKSAFELIAAYQYQEKGYTLTGLYEIHNYRVLGASHLALFYGGGGHFGYYNGGYYKNRSGIYYEDNAPSVGIDGVLGIDYYEPGVSLDWSLDVKPYYDFINPGFRFWDAALSIRYAFQ